MRVLILAEQLRRPVPGGIGTYLRGLLQGLEEIGGVEVRLTSTRLPMPLPAGGGGVDVVHAPSLFTRPTRAPLSVMVHDVAWRAVPDAFPPRGRRWHERALAKARRRAAMLFTPAAETAARLDHPDVHVIEEGCDHLPPPDDDAAATLLASLGVHGPFVLTLSTIEPRKNLQRLVRAYGMARLGLPLVVVGPAGWGPALAPSEGVVPAGFVDEAVKSSLLRRARLLAYVPLLEGWGLPPTEAMHVGTPVVASPMPSVGDGALVVDPTDVEAIAAALVQVTTDDALRQRLVAAGTARAAKLTWAETARRHVALWEKL